MSAEAAADAMEIGDYLAQGGKLTAPENVPARYRAELLRLMASFVDSALAGAAGFADRINDGPGVTERIAAARITLEKFDHAERVLKIMGDFGAATGRYVDRHPWAARLPREADIGATRSGDDMRLSVFHYPLTGWADSVVMNTLMGKASVGQIEELTQLSYQPLAEVFRAILPRETRHAELGEEGFRRLAGDAAGRSQLPALIAYWRPRIAASFGSESSRRFDMLKTFGLRHTPNAELRKAWETQIDTLLAGLELA